MCAQPTAGPSATGHAGRRAPTPTGWARSTPGARWLTALRRAGRTSTSGESSCAVLIEPKHRDGRRRHAHRPLRASGLRGARAASVPVRGAPGRREHRPRARGLPPSSCRVRRGRSRPPRPYPTARRRRSGLAMAPRRRPGMRVAAFSEALTGTASSRASMLPPTSPAATWHGTGGAGAPRSAAWPSRSSQRGDRGCSERRTPARCAQRDDSVHKP